MFANTDLIEAVANRNVATLAHLEPVWDDQYDEPWYSTGKMGIVFKLSDPATGQRFALKVFKERDTEREERLRQIAEQLAAYPSPYWVSYQFLADEVRIESPFADDETACVLLMEWIEGQTMGQFVRDACARTDRAALHKLAYAFDQMALWLLANPFAHGDLKHDNIIVRPNGVPALVDYDGLFFPVFTDLQALELGTPDYQHPKRTAHHYGLYLDDFSLLVISLSLYALSHRPDLYTTHNTSENLILTLSDFEQPRRSQLLGTLQEMEATPVRQRLALLDYALVLPPQSLPGLEVLLRDKVGHWGTLQGLMLPCVQNILSTSTETVVTPVVAELIPYRKGNKWGFCDWNKKIIIDCVYDRAWRFVEGMARVRQDEKEGFIDETGQMVIPCHFYQVDNFKEGMASVRQDGRWGFVNKIGELITPCLSGLSVKFSEGLAKIERSGKWGFIDTTGAVVIACQFEEAGDFSEGLARVRRSSKKNEWGLIDQSGDWGFIDRSGYSIIPYQFEDAGDFKEGLAKVKRLGNWGFIGIKGKVVIPCRFDFTNNFSEGLAEIKQADRWGFIDKNGKQLSPYRFEWAFGFSSEMARVKENGKWGYIDKNGNVVISCSFDNAEAFFDDLACVEKDEKWGFIDKAGHIVIDNQFDYCWGIGYSFSNGLAEVLLDNKHGYIDCNGNQYWED
ncbi:MAG: hypothetical protein EAZ91_07405 [Cytophagales bacterium]|nr:MAG: hypothetical protein EAZ91_07405 [Cytophagales bacterium]